jgi:biotin transporter BioY
MADLIWPGLSLSRELSLILAGSILIALSAHLEIPLRPVPITGQSFGVLLVGALLGSRRGVASVLSYLGMGAIGLPVFAGGASGIARFGGPTGGYLLGFVAAAFIVGRLSERGWDRRAWSTAAAMLIGTASIYLPGVIWLATFVGWERVFQVGVLPFIIGDLLKVALASLVLPLGWAFLRAFTPGSPGRT